MLAEYTFAAIVGALLQFGLPIAIIVAFIARQYLLDRKTDAQWNTTRIRNFAEKQGLHFQKNRVLGETIITGVYQGHHLHLKVSRGWLSLYSPRTIITLSALNQHPEPTSQSEIDTFFSQIFPLVADKFTAEVHFEDEGQTIAYTQPGFILMPSELALIVATMGIFLKLNQGRYQGNIQTLQKMANAKNRTLTSLAAETLQELSQQTERDLKPRLSQLFCPHCLARFGEHSIRLSGLQTITYYGCRLCRQSQDIWEVSPEQAIIVLDDDQHSDQYPVDSTLHINWGKRSQLFDFDRVEIGLTSDEVVERFAVQVGNDTDPWRTGRYSKMTCFVSPESQLSENTKRILKRTFQQIEQQ